MLTLIPIRSRQKLINNKLISMIRILLSKIETWQVSLASKKCT